MADNESTGTQAFWIRLVATYLSACTVLLVILLLWLWPSAPEASGGPPAPVDTSVVVQGRLNPDSTIQLTITTQPDGETVTLDDVGASTTATLDTTLVLVPPLAADTVNGTLLLGLIFIVGALGACLHALNSIGVFVGNRSFEKSWVLWYLLRPVTGALLALIFLFVIKGGFGLEVKPDNLYGVLAVAGLVGLFSKQAIDKLADLANTIFQSNTGEEYKDKLAAQPSSAPVIDTFNPPSLNVRATTLRLVVVGSNFVEDSKVQVNDAERKTVFDSATQLTATLLPADVAEAGTLQVKVVNPDEKGGASAPKDFEVTALPNDDGGDGNGDI